MNATRDLSAPEFKPIQEDADFASAGSRLESTAKLDSLPEGLEFPPGTQKRIRFDPRRKRLVYFGFMSKAEYDRLRGLSTDAAYQQALDQLFRESSSHMIAVDIGKGVILEIDRRDGCTYPLGPDLWRWALQVLLTIAALGGGAVFVWWWLSRLL